MIIQQDGSVNRRGERSMTVHFVKLSEQRHRVEVHRADGTHDTADLDTRSFLRHDLAHYAVEATLGLQGGVWGSIAAGGSFDGNDLDGADMTLAETLAGPVQTLMRIEAPPDEVYDTIMRVAPETASREVADHLHAWMRALTGRWRSTGYGDALELEWPPFASDNGRSLSRFPGKGV